ncbi:unnamed protein product [Bursaphelenchus xylophilus]|uniref:(pine wood nematode) hypothetical protein n=1 Tax=Bursaphelenchus xylophilus TaxID=6326 RepID=A0A1I7RQ37_BURXY|nr:unnamed protein product [Bursaphelenchus xylophilus]CAG9097095.1 unnamed protein product [Bursaphelenchus xylophilus]
MNLGLQDKPKPMNPDTWFVTHLNRGFRLLGGLISNSPIFWLSISTFVTLICSASILFTPLTNDVSDFTPIGARARKELQVYKDFFSNAGDPVTLFIFVTAKNEGNMLGVHELEEAVKVLNVISDKITLKNPITNKNLTFNQFCNNFCTINEPVRHFYNGLLVDTQFGNESEHIDLSYPVTTVLGRKLYMDPNFFGVKIATKIGNQTKIMSVNELRSATGRSLIDKEKIHVKNNMREIKLVGLQFRAEFSKNYSIKAVRKWENDVIKYARNFQSDYVDVLAMSESFLTDEVVRSGLSLVPFLAIGFSIMSVFSVITMSSAAIYMRQMSIQKVILAVMGCVCPFMACGTALGLMFWTGFRFGSILCVTPFLVLAIGVDDAYLMVNSWQRIRHRMRKEHNKVDLRELLVQVMEDTGASITITTLTNVLAFLIGAMTPTPEIQLFSIGNALAIVIDYIYQWTIFGSVMVMTGRFENNDEKALAPINENEFQEKFRTMIKQLFSKFLDIYCKILTNTVAVSAVIAILAGYMYISLYGVFQIKAELKPEQLFIADSDIIKILELRNKYISPFYTICIVFVNNPGNFTDPSNIQRLSQMVADFENLPSSLGPFSTKFFLRDYEEFIESSEETVKDLSEELADLEELVKQNSGQENELKQFLEWPEFQFWKGFVRLEQITDKDNNKRTNLTRFFFTTASHGNELRDWSNRAKLLEEWRKVGDSYPEYDLSIYEDDAKFLDLIPTMIPQTLQSSLCTLICMVLVCLLFIRQPTAVLVANFSIFSTCVGVFGILSLWGVDLDPIVMSAAIMSIGFSVDIPAHISYHYYKTGIDGKKTKVEDRLKECLKHIGFPVLEAGISTIICVMSLTLVELHMARVFAKTMVLVVGIGLVHGLLVIPSMFYLISLIPFPQSRLNPVQSVKLNEGISISQLS